MHLPPRPPLGGLHALEDTDDDADFDDLEASGDVFIKDAAAAVCGPAGVGERAHGGVTVLPRRHRGLSRPAWLWWGPVRHVFL